MHSKKQTWASINRTLKETWPQDSPPVTEKDKSRQLPIEHNYQFLSLFDKVKLKNTKHIHRNTEEARVYIPFH